MLQVGHAGREFPPKNILGHRQAVIAVGGVGDFYAANTPAIPCRA